MHSNSKGSAVKILSEMVGVNLEKVIAFGDNNNDVELLETVGMPIAMSNALDELKLIVKLLHYLMMKMVLGMP